MITEHRVSTGKRRWFSDKVLPQEPLLRQYLRRILPEGSDDCEDLLQDVYARILAIKDTAIPPIGSTCSFLCAQAYEVVIERLRGARVVSIDTLSELRWAHAMAPLAAGLDTTLDTRQEVSLLRRAICHLPRRLRRIMVLCKVHGFRVEEIARHLGVPERKVERQLSICLRSCATFMFDRAKKHRPGLLSQIMRRGVTR